MRTLIILVVGLLAVGCGKEVASGDLDNELMKIGMKWDADIKILKLEVEHLKADVKRLKADVKRLEEDNNASSARNKNK